MKHPVFVEVRELAPPKSFGSLSLAFGFVSALVAYGIMRAADTPWFDYLAFYAGVAAAAFFGTIAAWLVQRLGKSGRFSKARWLIIPVAGALVGMVVQAVPLRTPIQYYVGTAGLTKAEPITWILAGVPLGAIPAVVVGLLLHVCLRVSNAAGRAPALDASERMIVPAVGTCLVLATGALHVANPVEAPIIILILILAAASLGEVVVRDLLRARWLSRAFKGHGGFLVIPRDELRFAGDLPAFVGGVDGGAAIVHILGETSYRAAARAPVAETSAIESVALRPLVRRRIVAGVFVAGSVIVGGMLALTP